MATVKVKAAQKHNRVSFFERHPDHPKGAVFVRGNDEAIEAAETAALKRAIREGRLVLTQQSPVSRQQTPPTETRGVEPQGIAFLHEAGYDRMNVLEAVEFIQSLAETERRIALQYEKRNKNRGTVFKEFS